MAAVRSRALTTQPMPVAQVEMGEPVLWRAAKCLTQVVPRGAPLGAEVEFALTSKQVHRRERGVRARRGSERLLGVPACLDRRHVLIDAEPDVRLGEPCVGARVRSGRARARAEEVDRAAHRRRGCAAAPPRARAGRAGTPRGRRSAGTTSGPAFRSPSVSSSRSTMARAISSWSAKMSSRSRSKRSLHSW